MSGDTMKRIRLRIVFIVAALLHIPISVRDEFWIGESSNGAAGEAGQQNESTQQNQNAKGQHTAMAQKNQT